MREMELGPPKHGNKRVFLPINMNRIPMSFVIVFVLILSVLAATSAADSLLVVSPRTLNDSLALLQKRLECVITFEDAPYEYISRVKEAYPGGMRIPREYEFAFEFQRSVAPIEIIMSLLDAYRKLDDTTIFKVEQDRSNVGMYHVFPVEYLDREGKRVAYNSIMSRPISYVIQDGASREDSLHSLCNLLSVYGTTVDYAGEYYGGSFRPVVFTNAPARDCLMRMIRDITSSKDQGIVTWSIRRGPSSADYGDYAVLYISKVVSAGENGADHFMMIESQRPLSTAMQMASKLLDCSVIYEDPEYICPCDVLRDAAGKSQIPSGGTIACSYNSQASWREIVATMVSAYNEQNRTGKFMANEVESCIYVFPTLSRDENGDSIPRVALLDDLVSPKNEDMTTTDYLKKIIESIAIKHNVQIECEGMPEAIDKVLLLPETGQTAAQVLASISNLTGKKLLWQLHYNPRETKYILRGYVQPPPLSGEQKGVTH